MQRISRHITAVLAAVVMLMGIAGRATAQPEGQKVTVGVGVLRPDDRHANFYNGSPQNENTVVRILNSEQYGPTIWNRLTEQGLISDAVSSYELLQVDEYGNMHYRLSVLLGVGLRYDWTNGMGWLARFDYAKLTAVGAFNLNANNNTGTLSNERRYVQCGISGVEKRINMDLGLCCRLAQKGVSSYSANVGLNVNNCKVERNDMEIAGDTYDIRDIWNGGQPFVGSTAYEYINQGGLGLGAFAGLEWHCQVTETSALSLGCTVHYTKIALNGYESYGLQPQLALRFDIGDFSFLDKQE